LLINIQKKFEILTVVKITILLFLAVTFCRLIGRYYHFGGTYSLNFQGYGSQRLQRT